MQLNDLLRLNGTELDELYETARTPELGELEGDYDGLLLEAQFPTLDRRYRIAGINRSWLPWKGKVFLQPSVDGGQGKNRFKTGSLKFRVWNFETCIAPSQFGGSPACLVNYDIDGNSRLMRTTVFDEMKFLGDDLFLGKGGVRLFGRQPFVFYWAIGRPATTAA